MVDEGTLDDLGFLAIMYAVRISGRAHAIDGDLYTWITENTVKTLEAKTYDLQNGNALAFALDVCRSRGKNDVRSIASPARSNSG